MKTTKQKLDERNRKSNEYRKEANKLFDIVSPTRQSWYIKARLAGKTMEEAKELARHPKRG